MTEKKIGIHIFTRDLRIVDNQALLYLNKEIKTKIMPIFIFNKKQIENKNEYKSNNSVQFMCECLEDLDREIKKKKKNGKLLMYYGETIKILKKIIEEIKKEKYEIKIITIAKDYTPYAKEREDKIKELCEKNKIEFNAIHDHMITETGKETEKITNANGKAYMKFTPYMREAIKREIKKPDMKKIEEFVDDNKIKKIGIEDQIRIEEMNRFYKYNPNIWVKGGRERGLEMLKKIPKTYDKTRDNPSKQTTNLSAYLKFNVISVREAYEAIKKTKNKKLISQIYWRDFYMSIMDNYEVINKDMNNKKIKWKNNEKEFELWKEGKTGYPLVDAGMRQLMTTGYMHNRVRMVVGSFLVKIMHQDWRKGEKYFAKNLVDYDPSNNNGGWQWVAGTGTDSQPYFRYLNPITQSIKFDKECIYIKKYVPELEEVKIEDIHQWETKYKSYPKIEYPKPLYINEGITKRAKEGIKMYK
jgi:deoxyribodipyrimidine photo-lyase